MTGGELRCLSCNRLLAVRLESGYHEIKRGGVFAIVERGRLYCSHCRIWIEVDTGHEHVLRCLEPAG